MTDTWNPAQYDKFRREREQPFFDLLSLVRPAPDMRVVDLGCGTGALTAELHARLRARETVGIDRSARMLENAPAAPGLRFESGTIEDFIARTRSEPESEPGSNERYDLVFSNAALHWVDDHEAVIAGLSRALTPRGQLAFQVPAQYDTLTHVTARALADEEPFKSALGGWRRTEPVLPPDVYARLLYRYGFADPNVRLIVYPHILAGPEDVVEWVKGTTLTEYERRLPPELYARFVADYREQLLARLAPDRPCFFPFKRILCWGQRSA
jgi:trans-aconitate 2-methyltransferase